MNIEDTVLFHIIRLLKKDIPENVKSLTQYFIFFMLYSQAGRHKVPREREQLTKLLIFIC